MTSTAAIEHKRAYDRARYERRRKAELASRPPDVVLSLPETTLAYIAGVIDGEGSIYVAAVGPQRNKTVYPIVVVAMTDKPIIEWLADTLGAGKVQLHNHTSIRRHPHLKPQYRVQLFGRRAQLLCMSLLPYLRVKKEQARLVTLFPVDARVAPGVKIERSAVNRLRYELRDRINSLNHGKET